MLVCEQIWYGAKFAEAFLLPRVFVFHLQVLYSAVVVLFLFHLQGIVFSHFPPLVLINFL